MVGRLMILIVPRHLRDRVRRNRTRDSGRNERGTRGFVVVRRKDVVRAVREPFVSSNQGMRDGGEGTAGRTEDIWCRLRYRAGEVLGSGMEKAGVRRLGAVASAIVDGVAVRSEGPDHGARENCQLQ